MRHYYKIEVEIDTASVSGAVKDLEASLNESMQGFGCSEKIVLRTALPFTLSVDREATKEELDKVAGLILSEMSDRHAEIKSITKLNESEVMEHEAAKQE